MMDDESLSDITIAIDAMLIMIGRDDHALRDVLTEKIREYGEARYQQGHDAGFDQGRDAYSDR